MHLAAGLVAGGVIGILCFTGAALAFEQEIIAWAEGDMRRVTVPADGARLAWSELTAKMRIDRPGFRPTACTIENDPAAAVIFTAGREGAVAIDPYTGEIREPAAPTARNWLAKMTEWHRYLARGGDARTAGKLITGICNLAFGFLALSGLFLWMPRTWSWLGVRAIAVLNFQATGKVRDFNWHHVMGLWAAPVLIVLTLSAVPISFRWGSNLIYRIAGEEVPDQAGSTMAPGAPSAAADGPTQDVRLVIPDAMVGTVQTRFPRWTQLTVRFGSPGPRVAGATSALTISVREAGTWPRTATTTLTLHPHTGEFLSRTGYADLSPARKIRAWTRFLHTGQALGWPGQLVAGLACLAGGVLVYTGFALSWRRFVAKKIPTHRG